MDSIRSAWRIEVVVVMAYWESGASPDGGELLMITLISGYAESRPLLF